MSAPEWRDVRPLRDALGRNPGGHSPVDALVDLLDSCDTPPAVDTAAPGGQARCFTCGEVVFLTGGVLVEHFNPRERSNDPTARFCDGSLTNQHEPPDVAPDGPAHATVDGVELRHRTAGDLGIAGGPGDEYRSGPSGQDNDRDGHTAFVLRHLAGELRDGPPVWITDEASWRSEVAGWLEYHADQQAIATRHTRGAS